MRKQINKKLIISLVAASLVVAVGFTAMGIAIYRLDKSNRGNELIIENYYQESLMQMSESMSNIEVNMSKLMVSTSDIETAVLLNDTYRHSQAAINALHNLPIDLGERRVTDKFLNQLGDWCDSKSKSILSSDSDKEIAVSADVAFDKDEIKSVSINANDFDSQIEQLYIRAEKLNNAVKKAAEKLDGSYSILSNLNSGLLNNLNLSDTNQNNSTEVPELIYDGPFSDGANQKVFKCLDHKEELSKEAAIEKAEKIFEFLGLRNVRLIGEPSNPDSYAFSGDTKQADIVFNITKKGGFVLSASLPCDNSGKNDNLSKDEASKKAIEYAALCGYKDLSPVWYTAADGFATVNLTPIKDGIVFYPDLVKVKVCLVNGDFKGIEATGYCACHNHRDFKAALSKDEAAKAVSKKLDIKAVRLVVVPKDMTEKLCYEFSAQYKGLDYFVYIDAVSGKQVNIMRVINSEQGEMVM